MEKNIFGVNFRVAKGVVGLLLLEILQFDIERIYLL
jgi:hypothetical protein